MATQRRCPLMPRPAAPLLQLLLVVCAAAVAGGDAGPPQSVQLPVAVAGWDCKGCIGTALAMLQRNFSAVDAAVAGCEVAEKDTAVHSVGYGGSPDQNGETTLDALVTDGKTMNMGAVGALRFVREAAQVAKLVLRHTTHTMLAGTQATDFATHFGHFANQSLATDYSMDVHEKWLEGNCQPNFYAATTPDPASGCPPFKPKHEDQNNITIGAERISPRQACLGPDNHDTIPVLTIDLAGDIAASTSTNGLTDKIPGRVGDSPIPGAGNYARNGVGACGATGNGDVMMRFLPCYQAVESMRLGYSPQDAVEDAIQRISAFYPDFGGHLVAVNAAGEVGAASSGMEFTYLVARGMDENFAIEVVEVQPVRYELPPGLTGGKLLQEPASPQSAGQDDAGDGGNPFTLSLASTHDLFTLATGALVGALGVCMLNVLLFQPRRAPAAAAAKSGGQYQKLGSV